MQKPIGFVPPKSAAPAIPSNGQGVNSASIKDSLLKGSAFTPQTGTATGDRAVSDYARGLAFSNSAEMDRDLEKSNAQTNSRQVQQGEQMRQKWGVSQMNRYKQLVGQKNQQSTFATKLLTDQIGMNTEWRTRLIGMMR